MAAAASCIDQIPLTLASSLSVDVLRLKATLIFETGKTKTAFVFQLKDIPTLNAFIQTILQRNDLIRPKIGLVTKVLTSINVSGNAFLQLFFSSPEEVDLFKTHVIPRLSCKRGYHLPVIGNTSLGICSSPKKSAELQISCLTLLLTEFQQKTGHREIGDHMTDKRIKKPSAPPEPMQDMISHQVTLD